MGGLLSTKNARCLDWVVPRTPECLAVDEIHRAGVRSLTAAVAIDPTFQPGFALRAYALAGLKEYRQAIRDYDEAIRLAPSREEARGLYNDRGLAKSALGQYRAAVEDFSKSIAIGCTSRECGSYNNRADVYLKLHDYEREIADINHEIDHVLSSEVGVMNIEEFRLIYPEYDAMPDQALAEKLRQLYFPQFSPSTFTNLFIISNRKRWGSMFLPDLFLRRGDAFAALGQLEKAKREYDRVERAFPEWAKGSFAIQNGRRIRRREE
jgi:tetratricopeptide (TPR) repeat protein